MNESEKDQKYFVLFRRQSAIWWNWQRKEGPGKRNCVPIFMFVYILSVPTSYNQKMMSCLIRRQSLPVVGLVIDYR